MDMDRSAMYTSLSNRFDKLDEKLDVLVATMARYEERLAAGNSKFERHEFRLDHIEGRVNGLENAMSALGGKSIVWERAAWIIFSAVVAIIVKFWQY
jgi:tetrahydromethanopterin S-methyltransferase subunit G